ncbi:MgtC/SapB family protein [Enterococcus nangangensis]|uniref:MgtC/SapB family protein n=1 Tax=Enterococcus nangangensis TaxID=2559926 RepID=UPI0010F81687|nr:MgtC/SapB family protein [Enterococcus nangangensis]
MEVSWLDIVVRLGLALLIGGMIGFEREFKNRPAGTKTHILVCMGACVIGLIQQEIALSSLAQAQAFPQLAGVIRSDEARLIAQVVSGVGFLGAGTIIVTKRSVVGLTTAASIWAVAGLGIACGMGYYPIAVSGTVGLLMALLLINRLLRHVPMSKKIEIKYLHKTETQEAIQTYFEKNKIKVIDVNFSMEPKEEGRIYTNLYTVDLPHHLNYPRVIEDISTLEGILKIRTTQL